MATKTGTAKRVESSPPTQTTTLDITPPREAQQALTLPTQAEAIVVRDRVSHGAAKEFVRGAKQLKRVIEDHWSAITRRVDEMKRSLLELKARDLAPVTTAIALVEQRVLRYENEETRRVQEEEDRRRREAEATAQREREALLARQEREALALEAQSETLSSREQHFVDLVANGFNAPIVAARAAGYKDPEKSAAKLMDTVKIVTAISGFKQAAAIRHEAEAKRRQPLDVDPIEPVEARVSKVAGQSTRTYYSGVVTDLDQLWAAAVDGLVPRSVFVVNQPAINEAATQLKERFEAAYPGCALHKRQGLSG